MTLEFSGANVKIAALPWQQAGLTWTATGYGERIPTRYMVRIGARWFRVYARCFSNAATLYIIQRKTKFVVNLNTDHAEKGQ